jgi:outer membrane protein OmpA-like peptidoglycan-associated protein
MIMKLYNMRTNTRSVRRGWLAVGFLVCIVPPAAALDLPTWKPQDICAKDSAQGQCLLFEQVARRNVAASWTLLPDTVRKSCLAQFTPPLEASWRILSDCIAIEGRRAQQARILVQWNREERVLAEVKSKAKTKADEAAQQKKATAAEAERQRIKAEEESFMAALAAQRKVDADAAGQKAATKKSATNNPTAAKSAEAEAAERKRVAEEEASFMHRLAAQRKADAEAARLRAKAKKAAAAVAEAKRVAAEEASFMKAIEAQRRADAEAKRNAEAAAKKKAAAIANKARQKAAQSCQQRLKQVQSQGVIRFALNSSKLSSNGGSAILDKLAKVAASCEGRLSIVVEGHTDSRGSAAFNNELSQARAEAVAEYLREKGIGADQISAQGFGSAKPIASNSTRAGRAKNRRIEFKVK